MNASTPRSALGVIPARYGASRFPGKPLAVLWGRPLIQHVWRRARAIQGLDTLVVATDDDRIADVARRFGAEVEMTADSHASGTDRVAEVAARRPESRIVVNLQGDEPELDAEAVSRLIAQMRGDASIRMATLAHFEPDRTALSAQDVVKLEVDDRGNALYFSREAPRASAPVLRHIGVYGFDRDFLLELATWPPGKSERAERLEQLRALERGVAIRVIMSERSAVGVDTPQQLEVLERRGPSAP